MPKRKLLEVQQGIYNITSQYAGYKTDSDLKYVRSIFYNANEKETLLHNRILLGNKYTLVTW